MISKKEFITSLFCSPKYIGYCWAKLFKTNIIKEYGILFDTNFAYNEDRVFVLEYAMHINAAAIFSKVIYNYRQHSESVMSLSKDKQKSKFIQSEIISANKIKEILNDDYPKVTANVNYGLLRRAYRWKYELKNQKNTEVLVNKVIKDLTPIVFLSKYIDIVTKIKLIIIILMSSFKT